MKVLVVEDDFSVRETLGMVLEAYHHEPLLVRDGEEAIKRLTQVWPDVMLLDLSLPGMSGEEVYTKIQNQFHRLPPTVVLSAVQQGADRARFMPGTWFLAKPYTIDQLAEILLEAAASVRGAA